MNPTIWALLVGIDEYQANPLLNGCVNDVLVMRNLLMQRYAVPAPQIMMLTNEQATRGRIIAAFREFLIQNPAISRDDQLLFYFGGHGSQVQAQAQDAEPDRLNETIVPYDSRTAEVFDIPDKTLRALIGRLAAAKSSSAGDNITIILDCCHSGSGTRAAASAVRGIPPDQRPLPADLDAELLADAAARGGGASAPGAGQHVLLAACKDEERAHEYIADPSGNAISYGAFTYFLIQALYQLPQSASYADLHRCTASLVTNQFMDQHPQCEGDRDRQIFQGTRAATAPAIPLLAVSAGGRRVTLGIGQALGLSAGSKLVIYQPEQGPAGERQETAIARVEVVWVASALAEAVVIDAVARPIQVGMIARVSELVYAGLRQTVAVLGADQADRRASELLRAAIAATGSAGALEQPSPFLQLVAAPEERVVFRVAAAAGEFRICDNEGTLLADSLRFAAPDEASPNDSRLLTAATRTREALESIVRWRTIAELRNAAPASADLSGKIRVGLRRYVNGPQGVTLEAIAPLAAENAGLTIHIDPHDRNNNRYVVDVFNETAIPVYPHVFILNPDYSIYRIYPNHHQDEAVKPTLPGEPFVIGRNSSVERLVLGMKSGWTSSRDLLKIIVTTEYLDLQMLAQESLQVPQPSGRKELRGRGTTLQQLIESVAAGSSVHWRLAANTVEDEGWITLELPITSVLAGPV